VHGCNRQATDKQLVSWKAADYIYVYVRIYIYIYIYIYIIKVSAVLDSVLASDNDAILVDPSDLNVVYSLFPAPWNGSKCVTRRLESKRTSVPRLRYAREVVPLPPSFAVYETRHCSHTAESEWNQKMSSLERNRALSRISSELHSPLVNEPRVSNDRRAIYVLALLRSI